MLGGKARRDTRTSTADNILDSDSFWKDSQYPVVQLDNAWELRISSSLNERAKKSHAEHAEHAEQTVITQEARSSF
jgi:hypothetical protein